MIVQDGEKWYKPTEYADMYGKSRQSVNGLITRGSVRTRTIDGKTYVTGDPPWGWKPVSSQESMARKLEHMHPYDFPYYEEELEEGAPPKQEPFPGAWKLSKKYEIAWHYVAWAAEKLKNDPFKVALYFRIMDAKDTAFYDALEGKKPENPQDILFEHLFRGLLFKVLNTTTPEEVEAMLKPRTRKGSDTPK